jgi:hypothetical protein
MRPPAPHSRARAGKFAFSRILQLDDVPFGSSLADINIFCYSARACGAPLFAVSSLRAAATAAAFLLLPQLVVFAERRPPLCRAPQVGNTRQVPLLSVIPIAPVKRA